MIMQWKDLEPGDVLQYTDEYKRLVFPIIHNQFIYNATSLRIRSVSYSDNHMIIFFVGFRIPMPLFYNGADMDYINYYNGPVFKIIEVASNDNEVG